MREGLTLYIRLLLIAIVLLLAVFLVRRLYSAGARDPRLRQILSNISLQMVRLFLLRGVLGYLWRAVKMLRFFR